jgi:hypothetical protein
LEHGSSVVESSFTSTGTRSVDIIQPMEISARNHLVGNVAFEARGHSGTVATHGRRRGANWFGDADECDRHRARAAARQQCDAVGPEVGWGR